MSGALSGYLKKVFLSWWGLAGAVSLVGFFIPWLNNHWWFVAIVAMVTFVAATFGVYRNEVSEHRNEITRLKDGQTSVLRQLTGRHEAQLAEAQQRIEGLNAEIERLRRPRFAEQTRRIAEGHYRQLGREQKIALRHLLIADLTEEQALRLLRESGIAANWGAVLGPLAHNTPLVQRVLQDRQRAEHVTGYTGNYTLNPAFREVLEELVVGDPELPAES